MKQFTVEQFKKWGAKGGRSSHRDLSSRQAKIMALHAAAAKRIRHTKQPVTKRTGKAAHGTQEWATHNVNIQTGCEHDCKYCYAKSMAIRFKRSTSRSWKTPELHQGKVALAHRKRDGKTMFPTTHDITPLNIDACTDVIFKMLTAGNEVLIVTKPHLPCVKHLCSKLTPYRKQILFRFTIGTINDAVMRFWEPDTTSFGERLECLKYAFFESFNTSVSSEPMLDGEIDKVVEAVKPYVTDAIWLGRVNQIKQALSHNCPNDKDARMMAEELMAVQTDKWVSDLYDRHRADSKVKWKDSIKKVVGLDRPTETGLDV
jgi:DNA repair photolyase